MLKGFFLSLPSVSVQYALTPVIDEISAKDYTILYYNTEDFRPAGDHPFRFLAYPGNFNGYYSDRIDENTSYFQFGGILIDTAEELMDFLLAEVEREKPDFILHSHLAVWGKLLARHCRLPAITLFTTFVLDKRIMLPFFRKINTAGEHGLHHVHAAVEFYRRSHALYSRLQLKEKPDPWDVYINAGDLNLSFILEEFQPQRQLLDATFAFPGYPLSFERRDKPKKFIYVAMGTIVNKDIALYRMCIDVLKEFTAPCILSVGSKVDIAALGPVPEHIRIVPFLDQRAILQETTLFITRGGMASVHEAIHTLTPMIVLPVIPEQQVTAERIGELGIGIALPAATLSGQALQAAIRHILDNTREYIKNIETLVKGRSGLTVAATAHQLINIFLRDHPPAGGTIVDLFLQQAAKVPTAIALRDSRRQLTYEVLNDRVSRLANTLTNAQLRRNFPAAVVMEPCTDIVVAILGILRAGGCYIPIDPEYPRERIDYILSDSACEVILSNSGSLAKCGLPEAAVILVDEQGHPVETETALSPLPLPQASDLAYIMYTSGSTGRPKGVMVEHRQIRRYIIEVSERLELGDCTDFAIWGTFSADAGLTAVFAALSFGKTLNILDVKAFTDFGSVVRFFRQYPIDCYKITPSLLSMLLQQKEGQELLPVKRLILGGEACPWKLADQLYSILPRTCKLFNHYGPTETTVGVTTYAFPEKRTDLPASIPLGKSLPGVIAHLLDPDRRPVATGEPGELYIEGALIARGYLNNPELTEEKFTVVRMGAKITRVYKTGDIASVAADGNLEYLGRTDDQVKIRGNRIELKEIETAILSSGLVKNCLVLAKENRRGIKYLAAYVQPADRYEKEGLVQFVRAKLPAFMLPGAWIPLAAWPLTINNKTDRHALPDPGSEESGEADALYLPGGETQDVLTGIWKELLGVKHIAAQDDFFELGGDSLQLLRLSFEIHDRMQVEISLAELFHVTTIERLAIRLSQKKSQASPERLQPDDAGDATLAQRNLFLQHKLHPRATFPNSSLTYEVSGQLDVSALQQAFIRLIRENESLRTSYSFQQGKLCRQIAEEPVFRLEYISCPSDEPDKEIMRAVKPFDFGKPPLIRVVLLELGNTKKYLHVYMPHINSDGESMKIIMSGVEAVYNKTAVAPDRPQFSDFLKSHQAYLHSAACAEDEGFWKEQLAADIPPLPFNFTAPFRSKAGDFDGSFAVVPFPYSLNNSLCDYVTGKNITKFQTLFVSFALLLYKTTASPDVAVMLPVHGRDKSGFQHIIGLLSNVLPVRFRFDPGQSMAGFMESCRRTVLDAFRHQRYPFERMQLLWTKQGRRSANLSQAFFGYHRHRKHYSLGEAALKLYIPEREKENLPVSAAVFDTDSGMTLSISSAAGGFDRAQLQDLAALYFTLLYHVTGCPPGETVGALLRKTMLPAVNY